MLTTSSSATDAAVENAMQMESQTTNEYLWKTFPSRAKVKEEEKAKRQSHWVQQQIACKAI